MYDVTTILDPPGETPTSAPGVVAPPAPRPKGASLSVACALLGAVLLGGAVLALEPGQNAVDSWGFSVFPDVLQNAFLRAMSDLGLAPVTAGVSLVAGALVWRRDRLRTLACLAGPGLAVGMAELLKILVGRRFEGALCWPSGTTAAVTAVVTGVVLVTRGSGRLVAIVVGVPVVVFEVVALVAFRWHYLTDALGGVVLGVGCVLFVDAVLHRIRVPRRRSRPRSRVVVPASEAGPIPVAGARATSEPGGAPAQQLPGDGPRP
jgi:membrane-associated phospholipid phosphatase